QARGRRFGLMVTFRAQSHCSPPTSGGVANTPENPISRLRISLSLTRMPSGVTGNLKLVSFHSIRGLSSVVFFQPCPTASTVFYPWSFPNQHPWSFIRGLPALRPPPALHATVFIRIELTSHIPWHMVSTSNPSANPVMDTVLEIILETLVSILWWILLFPVILLAATPFILLVSLIGKPEHTSKRIADNYRLVFEFWAEWGLFIFP
ncbi:MAG: hypothetical protein JJU05_14985, partial [Verrucomicrobia bacterium]|nr:hypothetical protein [Verrucomicrobiota bacterium]